MSFDITGDHVNKGATIKKITVHYGYKKEEIVSIGAAQKDLSMFDEARYKVAMGNATDVIKAYCDERTADCKRHGVAQAIYKFIK